ncbi:MAG TPA: PQQ-dependent sugar dehydrogenase, partial [Vicinamibacterales bacterium]|nr:PQQ-dependent sugar dehydrogenase [Vicinamibacterales bacterium]
ATLLAGGFNRPNGVVLDPVMSGAVYVVDQRGVVRAFLNGAERPTPFLDLHTVISTGGEQGLLGMAFPPDAATSGRVFVNFTNASGHTVIARFTRSVADAMVIDSASRFDLQWPDGSGGRQGFIAQPYVNHNGGNLVFGPDGYLYIALGDGGSGDDPLNNAQNPATLLGKMLRIDVAGTTPNGYTIPDTNPVPAGDATFTGINALEEIWAFGLRNPWRYSFDDFGPGNTGALIVADVGQGEREEINYEPAGVSGRNYGWRVYEGTLENTNVAPLPPAYLPLQAPVSEYTHAVGQAITGGYVYRGTALGAAYQGRYFYADCVQGKVFSLGLNLDPGSGEATAGNTVEHTAEMGGPFQCIASFTRDTAGELYFMDFGYSASNSGRVFRIDLATPAAPGAPQNLAASVQGNAVTFTWSPPASGGTATSYIVEAGNAQGLANLGSATTTATSIAVGGVPTGQYFVRVRARNAVGTSLPSADVIATVGCTAPAPPATFTAAVSGNAVTLAWNVAAGTTATVIDAGYTPGATALSTPFAAPMAGIVVPGVPPGTYYLRARALNACGTSSASVERTVVIP